MQEEALERLREMQKRSRSMVAQPSTESQNSGHGNRSMGNNNNNNSRQGAGSPNHGSQGGSRPQEHSRAAQPAGQTYHGGNLMNTGFSVSEIFKSLLGEAGKLDTDSLLILLMLPMIYEMLVLFLPILPESLFQYFQQNIISLHYQHFP